MANGFALTGYTGQTGGGWFVQEIRILNLSPSVETRAREPEALVRLAFDAQTHARAAQGLRYAKAQYMQGHPSGVEPHLRVVQQRLLGLEEHPQPLKKSQGDDGASGAGAARK